MELFHFDIETVGEYKNFSAFEHMDLRGSKLFKSKYDKLGWDMKYDSIDEAYVENAGIVSTYGKIVCISFGYISNDGEMLIRSFHGDDEKEIINSFNELLKKIEKKDFKLCGFRINYFDIPWILHKLHKYDIKPADIIYLYNKKPWDCRIVDMSDDWKLKFAWGFSFDEMCYEVGVKSPKEDLNGSEVHTTYWDGGVDKVRDYCENDVRASIEVSLKLY